MSGLLEALCLAVESEEELDGPIPPELNGRTEDVARAAVRVAKRNILARVKAAWPAVAAELASKQPEPTSAAPMTPGDTARDRLWCQALCETLDPREIQAVTARFQEIRPDGGVGSAPPAPAGMAEIEAAVREALPCSFRDLCIERWGETRAGQDNCTRDGCTARHRSAVLAALRGVELAGWAEAGRLRAAASEAHRMIDATQALLAGLAPGNAAHKAPQMATPLDRARRKLAEALAAPPADPLPAVMELVKAAELLVDAVEFEPGDDVNTMSLELSDALVRVNEKIAVLGLPPRQTDRPADRG